MKYEEIVRELIVALRGSQSTVDLSKAMGYKYNQVRRWESGEKQFRWDEFCLYCKTVDIPLSRILSDVFHYQSQDPLSFLSFLSSSCFPLHTIEQLSEKLHRHPSAIRRYLDGEIFPDLEFVLAYIDLDYNRLADFILRILPQDSDSPLRAKFEPHLKMVLKEMEFPLAAAIEGWIATAYYEKLQSHDEEFIAARIGISTEDVSRVLAAMEKAGTVKRDEKGKYVLTYEALSLPNSEKGSQYKFYKYWSERASRRYSEDHVINRGPVRGTGLCRVVAVSQNASIELNQILLRADAEIRTLLERSNHEPFDDVRVISFNIFSTQDF